MWANYEDLSPEERLDKIVEILTRGVMRLIEKNKSLSGSKIAALPAPPDEKKPQNISAENIKK